MRHTAYSIGTLSSSRLELELYLVKEYVQEGVQKVAQEGAKGLELFQYLMKEFVQGDVHEGA